MRTPLPVLAILIAYLVFSLKIGPAFMENRPAFKLKMPLLIYNTAQVLYSGYLFWNVSTFLFFNYHTVIMIAIIFRLQMSPTTGQRPLLLTFISPYPELYLAHHSIPHRHHPVISVSASLAMGVNHAVPITRQTCLAQSRLSLAVVFPTSAQNITCCAL